MVGRRGGTRALPLSHVQVGEQTRPRRQLDHRRYFESVRVVVEGRGGGRKGGKQCRKKEYEGKGEEVVQCGGRKEGHDGRGRRTAFETWKEWRRNRGSVERVGKNAG